MSTKKTTPRISFREKLQSATIAFTFKDVIMLPGWTTIEPREVDLSTRLSKNHRIKIPFVSSPMDTVTEGEMAIAMARLGGVGILHRNCSIEEEVGMAKRVKEADPKLLCGSAISPFDLDRAKALEKYVDLIVTDVAHFHNANVFKATKDLLKRVGVDVVVGNIGTYGAAEDVITRLEGIAGFRVGIGSGSICITTEVTRVGAPTLFAVAQVADAVHDYGMNIPVMADGGIKDSGDVALSLAAGASSVMMGRALAGCSESPGSLVVVEGKKCKEYRGMASPSARARRFAIDRYGQPAKDIAEGIETWVPYKGDVKGVVQELVAGLQASMGYVGARNISELWDKARFALITHHP